ncbi:hypothetical protein ACNFIA_17550 [Pseudomonas sp. NY15437]|uniref:hypothetical protein n=1 Tax=Pseudomonas sp. NY15437 TaxID=3400360 RepID=UPI003A866BF1
MAHSIATPGRKWIPAAKDPALTATNGDESVSGFYTKRAGGILFYGLDGQPFAFLVANKHRERFFVTAHQTVEGLRYMFCTTHCSDRMLGIEGMSYREKQQLAESIVDELESRLVHECLRKEGFTFEQFVEMANRKPTCAAALDAFYSAGLTADRRGIEEDGYFLGTALARTMLLNAGYEWVDGLWVVASRAAA